MKRYSLLIISLMILFLTFSITPISYAHMYNEGYSYAHINKNQVTLEVLIPFVILYDQYDSNSDYDITQQELDEHREKISDYMKERIQMFNGEEQMEFEMTSVQPHFMESQEAWVVKYNFIFTSMANIEDLKIIYRAIFTDIEPIHQNYMQVYKDDVMVAHRVFFELSDTLEYSPNQKARFTAPLLGSYILLGVQSIVKSVWHVALLLSIFLASKKFKPALENVTVFAAANLIGLIVADRMRVDFIDNWVFIPLSIPIVYLLLSAFVKKVPDVTKLIAVVLGFAHGIVSFAALIKLGIYYEFKTVTMIAYDAGILIALAGCVYILANVFPLILKQRKPKHV